MKKERVFTFKADEELAGILDRIPNKSEFIRKAIEMAMENRCPLCNGTGSLTPAQHRHMEHFMTVHSLERCDECNAVHLVCGNEEENGLH